MVRFNFFRDFQIGLNFGILGADFEREEVNDNLVYCIALVEAYLRSKGGV